MPSQLQLALAVDRANPCPWCGAQPGKPCRADKGAGDELTHAVHPVRRKPSGRVAS